MRFVVFYGNIIFNSAPKLHRHRNSAVNDSIKQVKDFDLCAYENIYEPLFRTVAVFRRPLAFFEVVGYTERFS